MSLLDTYKQKLDAQIKEHKAQLDLLKAKARKVAAQSKYVGEARLAEADKHFEHAKAAFTDLKNGSGTALGELKNGLQKALADLKASTQKAAKHFDATPPPPPPRHTKPRRTARSTRVKHAAKAVKHSKAAKAVKHAVKTAKATKPKGHQKA